MALSPQSLKYRTPWLVCISLKTYIMVPLQKLEVRVLISTVPNWTSFWDLEMRVANSGVAWKGPSEEVTYVQAAELKWAQWLRVGRGFQLRLGLRDHKKEKFDGFLREVHANKTLA